MAYIRKPQRVKRDRTRRQYANYIQRQQPAKLSTVYKRVGGYYYTDNSPNSNDPICIISPRYSPPKGS